jgi:hypothetical protein
VKVSGTHLLHAPRERVWEVLSDTGVLARSIPGCQRLERTGAEQFDARVFARVAAIDGVFEGRVTVSDRQAPASCTLRASGSGDPGTFEATAVVWLEDPGDGATRVIYDADAEVGGAIAGVGQRVLAGVAQRNAAVFLEAVDRYLAGTGEAPGAVGAAPGAVGAAPGAVAVPPGHPGDGRLAYSPGVHPAVGSRPQHLVFAALAGAAIALLAVLAGRRRS